jgi:hypothetical protein
MKLTLINFRGHLNESQVCIGHYFSLFKIDMPLTQIRAIALHFLDIIKCFNTLPLYSLQTFSRRAKPQHEWFCVVYFDWVFDFFNTHHFSFNFFFGIRELADLGIWDNITIKEALVLGIKKIAGFHVRTGGFLVIFDFFLKKIENHGSMPELGIDFF